MIKKILKGIVYFLGVCTLVSLICTACFDDETSVGTVETDNGVTMIIPEEPDSEVEIVQPEEERYNEPDFIIVEEPRVESDGYFDYIVGVVQNNTNQDFDYIQITFTLYDANDNVVGSAFANANNVKQGQTWKFDAAILEDDAVRFELDEITGW
jgi:hypothetical protein